MDNRNAPPLNPLPPVVWALALPMIAMEAAVTLGSTGMVGGATGIGWRVQALERFVFAPDVMRAMIEQGQYPLNHLIRLVTYPFVHASTTHALFVIVILLALGKMVGEAFRWWAVVVVFLGAAVAGAFAFMLVPGNAAPFARLVAQPRGVCKGAEQHAQQQCSTQSQQHSTRISDHAKVSRSRQKVHKLGAV